MNRLTNPGSCLNLNNLLTFAVVARFNSITRAAEQLNLGQPAISGQLRQLQEAVGEPLYERVGHRIHLTPAGNGLLEYAERLERDFRDAREYVRRLQHLNAGAIRIGSTMTIASYYLPDHVVALQRRNPEVHVSITTGDSREIVRRLDEMDLAFIEGSVTGHDLPAKFATIPWQQDEIVLIVHKDHEVARLYPAAVPLGVFAMYQVVWREPGSGARQVVESALTDAGVEVAVNIEVMGVAGVKESVRAGLGIGFASSQAMRHESAELVSRRIDPPDGLRWQLNILAPEAKMRSRACQTFLAMVCGHTTP